ncbi:hypothetical protein MRX96_019758 [Rhipicephalus microplus]
MYGTQDAIPHTRPKQLSRMQDDRTPAATLETIIYAILSGTLLPPTDRKRRGQPPGRRTIGPLFEDLISSAPQQRLVYACRIACMGWRRFPSHERADMKSV